MQSSTMVNQRVMYGNMTIVYSIFLTTHAGVCTHTLPYTHRCACVPRHNHSMHARVHSKTFQSQDHDKMSIIITCSIPANIKYPVRLRSASVVRW